MAAIAGIANTMVGVANIAENANGALIYGAGTRSRILTVAINFRWKILAHDLQTTCWMKLATWQCARDAGDGSGHYMATRRLLSESISMMIGVNTHAIGTQSDVSNST